MQLQWRTRRILNQDIDVSIRVYERKLFDLRPSWRDLPDSIGKWGVPKLSSHARGGSVFLVRALYLGNLFGRTVLQLLAEKFKSDHLFPLFLSASNERIWMRMRIAHAMMIVEISTELIRAVWRFDALTTLQFDVLTLWWHDLETTRRFDDLDALTTWRRDDLTLWQLEALTT